VNETGTARLTAPEVAASLSVSVVRVYQLTRDGRLSPIPGLRRGRARLYAAETVEAFARISRPRGVYIGPRIGGGGGAPRGNFNRWIDGRRTRRPSLRAFRLTLPLRQRRIFDDAVSAALRQASAAHSRPRRRHRARVAATALVVGVTYGARLAPVLDEEERYRNLVTALRPWREAETPPL
jgi:hypothetical protein